MNKPSPRNGNVLPEGKRFMPGEHQREISSKGGKAAAAKRAALRTLREELETLLAEKQKQPSGKMMTIQEGITAALIKQALNGDVRAYEMIRDTIGQKPIDRIMVADVSEDVVDEIEKAVNERS